MHIAGVKADLGVRVGGSVVQELNEGLHGIGGWLGLLGCDGAESWEHSEVNGSSVVQEGADDFEDLLLVLDVEEWGGVVGSILLA